MASQLQVGDPSGNVYPSTTDSRRKKNSRTDHSPQRNESSPLNGELLIAARKGNASQVRNLLREWGGAGATATDKVGLLVTGIAKVAACVVVTLSKDDAVLQL